jgi:hypothetical protein
MKLGNGHFIPKNNSKRALNQTGLRKQIFHPPWIYQNYFCALARKAD